MPGRLIFRFRKREKTSLKSEVFCIVMSIVIRGVQDLLQSRQGLRRVNALGGDVHARSVLQPHGQQAQQAFGVDAVVFPGDGDVTGELVGLFDGICTTTVFLNKSLTLMFSYCRLVYHIFGERP